jgi:hypothetical protein
MPFNYEFIEILYILLPGIISAYVFDSIRFNEKKSDLRFVFKVFIFSTIFHFIHENTFLLISIISVVLVPVIVKYAISSFSTIAINLKITRKSDTINAWIKILDKYENRFIAIHFKDGSRLFGYLIITSSDINEGLMMMTYCGWINSKNEVLYTDHDILVKFDNVDYITFYPENNQKEQL